MIEKAEKKSRGRPKGRLTEAEYKRKQRAKKRAEGMEPISLSMSSDFIRKIDFIVNAYPMTKSRADVFNMVMDKAVDAIYNRTQFVYEQAGFTPEGISNMGVKDKKAVNLIMDILYTGIEAGLEEHLGHFENALANFESRDVESALSGEAR